jgi:hypothetical protein
MIEKAISPAAGAFLAMLWATAAPASAQQMLKREPRDGALRCGFTVLVDDRTCPRGMVKEVTGGCNMDAGRATGARRSKKCVPRP